MKYSTTSKKSVQEVVNAIIKNSEAKDFGVTTVHNVSAMLHERGASLSDDYQILYISNPHYVLNLLSTSIDESMIQPSKIVIRTEDNRTVIMMVKLKQSYQNFTHRLDEMDHKVEREMLSIVNLSK